LVVEKADFMKTLVSFIVPVYNMKKILGLRNYRMMKDSIVTAYNLLVGRI